MAHPSRKSLVTSLLVNLKPIKAQVAWDEKNNIWDTCRRAWKLHDPGSDYHLVLQDDSILCHNFHSKLQSLIDSFCFDNKYLFSLYIGNRKQFRVEVDSLRPNGGILKKKNIHHEIALMFPTIHINQMINFVDSLKPVNDKLINHYVLLQGMEVIIPIPTLIQHANEPSLHNLNHSVYSNRKSIWFAG